jgi:hypothetical protein
LDQIHRYDGSLAAIPSQPDLIQPEIPQNPASGSTRTPYIGPAPAKPDKFDKIYLNFN